MNGEWAVNVDKREKRVDLIPATIEGKKRGEKTKKLRVAAYCRVSTEQEEQQSSYEAQIDYYTDKIGKNKDWELAGIFADEGITGTSAKKRSEFIKMINLCEKGKIDMVLTKSVSRFSRNTLDAIGYIRKLKAKGIPVIFEKEGINTMDMASEMALCFLSGFAQAESESISRNVSWGIRQSFKNGKVPFQYSRLLGYKKGDDGEPEIVAEEAAIIRRIYMSYLGGASVITIKKALEADGIPSPTGKSEWSDGAIRYILRNERYIGDAILQKTYVIDCLTKETRKNRGEIPQYYVSDNHDPIISREIFHLVQEEIARRAGKRKVAEKNVKTEQGKYSSRYALSERVVCGDCGTQYRRVTWARNGKKKVVWRCINRLEYGVKYCKSSPTIEEEVLHFAIVQAFNRMGADKDDILDTLKVGMALAHSTSTDDDYDEIAIKTRLAELQSMLLDLAALSAKSSSNADYFEAEFEKIGGEIKMLQNQLSEHATEVIASENTEAKVKMLIEVLDSADFMIREYDDALTRTAISKIEILSAEQIRITFFDNVEIEQALKA